VSGLNLDSISLQIIAVFGGYLAFRLVSTVADYFEASADERTAFAEMHRANVKLLEAELVDRTGGEA
jgi:hypothetical protein